MWLMVCVPFFVRADGRVEVTAMFTTHLCRWRKIPIEFEYKRGPSMFCRNSKRRSTPHCMNTLPLIVGSTALYGQSDATIFAIEAEDEATAFIAAKCYVVC